LDKEKLKEELRRDEGFRDKVYLCSQGHRTIGYGHLVDNARAIKTCTRLDAENWLRIDIERAIHVVESFLWPKAIDEIDPIRQRVLTNMAYNLGFRLMGFKKFYKAIQNEDWAEAKIQMLDSLWARQVGDRAIRLSEMMETGSDEGI
jgi:lysozyme